MSKSEIRLDDATPRGGFKTETGPAFRGGGTYTTRRYVGRARRGRSKGFAAIDDALDLRHAVEDLVRASAMLAEAHALSVWRKLEKRAAIGEAVALLALASRTIDAVVIRRGGSPGDVVVEKPRRRRGKSTARVASPMLESRW